MKIVSHSYYYYYTNDFHYICQSAINLLALTITSVAAGNFTPIAPYIFSKTGTTFHNIKMVIVVATVKALLDKTVRF